MRPLQVLRGWQFLQERPGLAPVLILPRGDASIVDGDDVLAVLDAVGNDHWKPD
ncbi:hypothetical protein LY474_23790 [Myxococcus stipitatus]|uniref:hypothetical protein n=1 Tax=Myxococcus stipitatus TaxID=83455 RepID=UPI001F35B8CC|nr:hypothetical protein [Myxococcus stipitatus]MCE9670834.1 hypothetical protein [Myxococcus stipitatus]